VSTFVCNKQQYDKSIFVLCKVKVRFTCIWSFFQ